MGIFSAAGALFGLGGVGQRERRPERPANDDGEPKSTILVIDDDPIVLQIVKGLLVERGFNVLTSSSSPKGLDMIRYASDIRIVVLDYNMPKLDGAETLNFIKQLSPTAKVIGLTGANPDSVTIGYLDGIDVLLGKPVVASTLIAAVDELLGDEQTVSARIEP
jgi:two-component system, sensor histidine kinase ChiS